MENEKTTATVERDGFKDSVDTYYKVIERLGEIITIEYDDAVVLNAAHELRWWIEGATGLGGHSTVETKNVNINKRSDMPLWISSIISVAAISISVVCLILR